MSRATEDEAAPSKKTTFGGARKGMTYNRVRELLLLAGFTPKARVPDQFTCRVAEHPQCRFPEAEDCSQGEEFCNFLFVKDHEVASVTTVGRAPKGEPGRVRVTYVGWDTASLAEPDQPEDVADGSSASHCIETAQGCLYDTRWKPEPSGGEFQALNEAEQNSGAGCVATDREGNIVLVAEAGGVAEIKIHGQLVSLEPTGETNGLPSAYGDSKNSLTIKVGREVAKSDEAAAFQARIIYRSGLGSPISADVRFECGA